MHLLVCIDGTHDNRFFDKSESDYDSTFKGSHVRRVADHSRFGAKNTAYIRGPAGLGTYVNTRFVTALRFIAAAAEQRKGPILLHFCGYSRGGAIALDLANELSLPPQGFVRTLARTYTYGKSTEVVMLLEHVRKLVAGRCTVDTLTLFDAVDMSSDIDGDAISARIRRVAHVIRSEAWGSRNGWGNVGTTLESGSAVKDFIRNVNGTHAALGGLPFTGDIPKPLARVLLAMKTPPMDWEAAERVFRRKPLAEATVRNSIGRPGLFVNPHTSALIDQVGKATMELPGFAKLVARSTPKATTPPGFATKVPPSWPPMPHPLPAPPLTLTLKAKLQKYLDDAGGLYGASHLSLNEDLRGAPGLSSYFAAAGQAAKVVNEYRNLDQLASRATYAWLRKSMGEDFPATT